ncbi:hypothetical protein SIXOD_v1c13460 [Spiroplasma ixodetis Y32]|nr:hypothetical protein SIXOD_v1c13460 [Spiroplasma ixodetis Y32]
MVILGVGANWKLVYIDPEWGQTIILYLTNLATFKCASVGFIFYFFWKFLGEKINLKLVKKLSGAGSIKILICLTQIK